MRNLKKILALVLALVMSLSLMATAGASSFPDVDAENPYATAIDVLDGLKVFQGFEDGTFKPTDTLNRAQAAVLVYRIATGDVEGKQVENYTYMAQSKFVDLDGYNWAKGYINYCQNAGIVVGTDATHFNPGGKVTGYQLLVMLLRTLGYGKAGEFADPKGWELQTASIAEREGITKYITNGDFGAAAPRQMVAEILFRGLLTETVTYSQLTSGGYTKTGETLGKRELDLEELEGVVMANEYASLTSSVTAKDGKTELLSDGKTYTLNTTTTLDDIGENRHAYIQNSTVLYMEDVGNTTEESTDAEKVSDILSRAGITDGGENFINFDRASTWTSPWKIKYEVNVGPVAANNPAGTTGEGRMVSAIEDARDLGFILPDIDTTDYDVKTGTYATDNDIGSYKLVKNDDKDAPFAYDLVYSMEFKIRAEIGLVHQSNIELIFNIADKNNTGYIDGEVYYGTSSLDDASDELTLEQFIEKCIDDTYDVNIKSNDNGNWVKVIDNNGDGVAEYIFKVIYTVAQVSNKKDDKITLDTKNRTLWIGSKACETDELNNLTSQPVVANDEMDKDDIVYYAIIDGKAQTYMTEKVTATIEKVDHNKLIATTTDGTPYTQSDVHEHIEDEAYASDVRNLAGKISYDLFLDRGGYLAAFVKPEASNFVLITDAWYHRLRDGHEYAVKYYDETEEKIVTVDITENASLFISRQGDGNDWDHLKLFGADVTDHDGTTGALNGDGVVTKTIVAALTADGTLLPVENSSVTGRYPHNILDLHYLTDPTDPDSLYAKIPGKAPVNGQVYFTKEHRDTQTAYNDKDRVYNVRALNDTIYYVVYDGVVVGRSVGYANAPKASDLDIEDIYAVGTLHEPDNNLSDPYYTADIVVVELNSYTAGSELVFVVDDTARDSDVRYRRVALIHSDGTLEEDVRIDHRGNTQGYDDNVDGGKKIQPGFYEMTKVGEDTYTLYGPLDREEIRDTGKIAVGQVDLSKDVKDKTFIATRDWDTETFDRISNKDGLGDNASDYDPDYVTANTDANDYDINADTKLYKLAYGSGSWRSAGYPVVDDTSDVLTGRVNEVDSNSRYADSREDSYRPYATKQEVFFNYNDVMVFHNDKGVAIYVVSFENFDGNTDKQDWAQDLWESIIPDPAKDTNIYIPLEIRAADGEEVTVEGVDEVEYDETRTGRELKLPGEGFFQIKVTVGEDVDIDSIIINAPGCTREGIKVDEDGAYIITFRYTKPQTRTVAAVEDTNVIATVQYVQETIIDAFDEIVEDGVVNDKEAYDELMAALEIYAENEVPGQTVAAEAETEIKDAVEAAEDAAAEELVAAKNAALVAISEALSVAEPYWANDPMGLEALKAEIDAIKAEIASAEDTETVTAKKAEALSKITVPATLDVEEVLGDSNGALPLFTKTVGVDVTGVPAEKKLVLSTKTAPAGYTKEDILADDDLIKALLSWNDSVGETAMTGDGTAESPWKCGNDGVEGRQYVKNETDATDGKIWVNTFLSEKLGKFFPNEGKVIFVLLDMEAAGIEDGVTLLQPINTTMLGADKCFETGAYGSDVKITVDCSGIQWGE